MKNITNKYLNNAKNKKDDEFYTPYDFINKYFNNETIINYLKDKVILLNCNDINKNFQKWLVKNYDKIKYKKLIVLGYKTHKNKFGKVREYYGNKYIERILDTDGSYDSEDGIYYLKQADVIITNPPFSKIRDYIKLLKQYKSKYILIAPKYTPTYKGFFTMFKTQKTFVLYNKDIKVNFIKENTKKGVSIYIISNIEELKELSNLEFKQEDCIEYDENIHNTYIDNTNILFLDKVSNIPKNYNGYMAVPLTILKYKHNDLRLIKVIGMGRKDVILVNKQKKFKRILVKWKNK